jgi:hypothetical protein
MSSTVTETADLAGVARELNLPKAQEVWGATWPRSQATYRPDVVFLRPDYVAHACDQLHLSDPLKQAFVEALAGFEPGSALERLFWHWHHELFVDHEPASAHPADRIYTFPLPPASLGPGARLFAGLVLLSGVHWLRRLYAARGIPLSVMVDTLTDIEVWANDYRCQHGHWGFTQFPWLILHFSGRLFRLGRLQFEPTNFTLPFYVYRHRASGEVAVLAWAGQRFRADGQFANADEGLDPRPWVSDFADEEKEVRGQRVNARGAAEPAMVALPRAEWERVVGPGDPILNVHIPATGPMDHAACVASFEASREFFSTHFQTHRWKAWTCFSWLMDPQLADHMPAESNVVRFLREFVLFPLPGASARQTIERVLGGPGCDHGRVGKETALQRAVRSHMERGGKWRGGSGVRVR